MEKTRRGKFIVLYGINNLGKTTQAKILVDKLKSIGEKAEYIKYPIYELTPSGVVLNNYLRGGNIFNLAPREAQVFYAKNRTQYEKELTKKLENGIHVVAEDYTGTGIAWGIGAGVDEMFLKYINSHLLEEDLAFLFDGERFKDAVETGHKHETDDNLTNKVRWAHLKLAEEKNWKKINANLSIEEIQNILWKEILGLIKKEAKKESLESPNILIVERLSPTAKLPSRAHSQDAGFDLYADDYHTLMPGDSAKIKTGIKIKIPDGHVGLIWDKGGMASSGIHTMGGVIDAGYRGEIIILIKNLGHDIFNIQRGQKIAQILVQKIELLEIRENKIKDETDRQARAFGSTGLF